MLEKIPLLLLAAAISLNTLQAEASAVPEQPTPVLFRAANAVRSYGIYLLQTVWPVRLAPYYMHPENNISMLETGLAAVVLAAASVWALRQRSRRPWLLTGWLWYLGMLVPVIGLFVQAGGQAHADRYTYLPQIGVLIMLTWTAGGAQAVQRLRTAAKAAAAAAVTAALAAAGFVQTGIWRDSITLYSHAIRQSTDNAWGYVNLAYALTKLEKHDEAIRCYQQALRLFPDDPESNNNLGATLVKTGRLDEALEYYRRALKADPSFVAAHFNMGNALVKLDRTDEAAGAFEQVLRLEPGHPEANNNMGVAAARRGRPDEAAGLFRRALQTDPDYAEAHRNLGLALAALGQSGEAARHFQEAVRLKPDGTQARNDLDALLERQANLRGLLARFRTALAQQPDSPVALNNLAWLLATAPDEAVRDGAEAVRLAERACELSGGNHPGLLDTLAAAYAEAGRLDEAQATARRAADLARSAGDEAQARAIEAHLDLYRRGLPLRQ